jgi:hypothetical protein
LLASVAAWRNPDMPPRGDPAALSGALFLYPFRARNPLTGMVSGKV